MSEPLTPLQQQAALAMKIKELRAKLEQEQQRQIEPIAIVGMGCRFPGAPDVERYWALLRDGVDAISEVPPDRWALDQWFDPNPNAAGKINTRYGGFIEGVDRFDAAFFGIPPREAARMDPAQRLLLQVVWSALEHASIAPLSLRGSRSGFFVGITQNDYGTLQMGGDPAEITAYSGTGNGFCFASGRIAFQFGLNGPVVASDTACSSSLVALHQAVTALRQRECDTALAAGVQLNLTPPMQIFLSKTQSFSADGRCFTFDARANGFVLGEGIGVVVLKRLSDALKSGDTIFATIRSTAINHDGPASGLTVPNEAAQEALIRQALQTARVEPDTIQYVETHGTATNLGDPIEIGALKAVFGGRSADHPLRIGSVKTNFGHLSAAAGMASLIKTVLMLHHGEIAPHLHFKEPNAKIPWEGFAVEVAAKRQPWPQQGETPRRAGVSSFGLSGTNGHLILEEAPPLPPRESRLERPLHLFTLSAKTEAALQQLARDHLTRLAGDLAVELADYCFSANAGRSHFQERFVMVVATWAPNKYFCFLIY